MAVSVFKTFSAGEVLSAADLNNSFLQITDNGDDLASPATKAHDMNGFEFILDADADTSITSDTDDVIHFRMQAQDLVIFDGDAASAVNGVTIRASATGVDVAILAQGSDTDIDLDLQSKGAGNVLINGTAIAGVEDDDNVLASLIYT